MVNSVEYDVFGNDDNTESDYENLVGLDANIPGGKYDVTLSVSAQNGEKLNVID